ncbi:MAG: hypothetical protein AAF310_03385 [Myxococcota bacterium]
MPQKNHEVVVPLLQHPTCLVCVDSSLYFLEGLLMARFPQVPMRLFNNPHLALLWLREHAVPISLVASDTALLPPKNLPQALQALRSWITRSERFTTISTVTSGFLYRYAAMDGLTFLQHLPDHLCKILHTAYPVTTQELKPFLQQSNRNAFVDKGIHMEPLRDAINNAQRLFFTQLTQPLQQLWTQHLKPADSVLFEPAFAKLLDSSMQQLKAVEHVVWDETGSCVLIEENGTTHGLCVRTPKQIERMLQTPQAQRLPADLQQKLRSHTLLPAHFTPQGVEHWNEQEQPQLYPAYTLSGQESFVYCHVPNVSIFLQDHVGMQLFLSSNPIYTPDDELRDLH